MIHNQWNFSIRFITALLLLLLQIPKIYNNGSRNIFVSSFVINAIKKQPIITTKTSFETTTKRRSRLCDTNGILPDYPDDDEDENGFEETVFQSPLSKKPMEPLPPLPSEYLGNYEEDEAEDEEDEDEDDEYIHKFQQQQQPPPSSLPPEENETRKLIQEQQRQIDLLIDLVNRQQPTGTEGSSSTATTAAVAPLKAMLFIDGTWLYYSIHQRRGSDCPIIKKFGRGWQHFYKFDWAALPRIICEQMQLQQMTQGWSSTSTSLNKQTLLRPIEIVRASVYTSYKKTTDRNSLRVRMFAEMEEANYDVHRMETLGSGEKCVDIQLAVEMLHYATVPNAYDVAILLSGDKDFIPAMMRTRQKGKQVGVVSMHNGCNRALYESSHIKDYDMVWIDDFLDQLIVPLGDKAPTFTPEGQEISDSIVSASLMMIVIYDFVSKVSGGVSSRDIGRFLKSMTVGNKAMLQQLKEVYGGLRHFLAQHGRDFFVIYDRNEIYGGSAHRDPRDRSFWVDVVDESEEKLFNEASLSEEEEKILKDYYASMENNIDKEAQLNSYYHTFEDPSSVEYLYSPPGDYDEDDTSDLTEDGGSTFYSSEEEDKELELPTDLTTDYSKYTLVMLKERCRERGLLVSGTKAVLYQRIMDDVQDQLEEIKREYEEKKKRRRRDSALSSSSAPRQYSSPRSSSRRDSMVMSTEAPFSSTYGTTATKSYTRKPPPSKSVDPIIIKHLEDLVEEYISARGGQAGSRDVGRYLASNPGLIQPRDSALKELKDNFGTLASFIGKRRHVFEKLEMDGSAHGDDYGFPIRLR